MDNNQQNPNNQGNSGISGFNASVPTPQNANPPENKPTDSIQGFPEQKPDNNQPSIPTPQEPPEPKPMPSETPASTPNNQPVDVMDKTQPSTPPIPEAPKPVEAPGGLEPTQNFTKQSIVGGVEDAQSKAKGLFSRSAPSTPPADPAAPNPSDNSGTTGYNEVTAGSHSKLAMIAIAVGVVLLLVTAGAYYYFMVLNKPQEVIEEQPVVEEIPVTPDFSEDVTIDQDPFISEFNMLESTSSAQPATLRTQINSLNFDGIDAEITRDSAELEQPIAPEIPANEPPQF